MLQVYLAEITADTQICAKRNMHGRKAKDINKVHVGISECGLPCSVCPFPYIYFSV